MSTLTSGVCIGLLSGASRPATLLGRIRDPGNEEHCCNGSHKHRPVWNR